MKLPWALTTSIKKKAVFLDKDGTLIENLPWNCKTSNIRLLPKVNEGLRILTLLKYLLIIVTNQSGIARGLLSKENLFQIQRKMSVLFESEGSFLHAFYCCPHDDTPPFCNCRKPKDGLLRQAAQELDIDLKSSWMIGDILDDVEAGHRAGCRSVLIHNGHETLWDFSGPRMPDFVAYDLKEAALLITQKALPL